jgi:hypothetical protein
MAKAQRKPAIAETAAPAAPQFTVLPDPSPGAAANPFGDDPLAAVGASPAKKGTKVYPNANLTDPQRRQLDELMRQKAEAKDLEGTIKTLQAQLTPVIVGQFIDMAIGRSDVPSSLVARGFTNSALIPICGDSGGRYAELPKENASQLVAVIGAPATVENFDDGTSLKIKLSDLPESKRPPIIAGILALFQEHGVMHCLEKKSIIVPKPAFKAGRWTMFDAETNRRINEVIPLTASFRAYNG